MSNREKIPKFHKGVKKLIKKAQKVLDKPNGPKILALDIETKPIKAWVWGIWDQNIGINQIIEDWSIISIAAKYLHSPKIYQADLRESKDYTKDYALVKMMWDLLDECDVVLTQGGKRFDIKKLNTKFLEYEMGPPSPYQHIDLITLKKSKFGMTSNKLEFTSDKLCKKNKKSHHKEFPGMELWTECLKGNQSAWKQMAKYNIIDVLAVIEEYETKFLPWDTTINHNSFHNDEQVRCPKCGGFDLSNEGTRKNKQGWYHRYKCKAKRCSGWSRGKVNLWSKGHKKSMLVSE